jgi:hypothetical protein
MGRGPVQRDKLAALTGVHPAWSFYPLARARGSACRRGYGVLRTGKAAPHLRFVKKGGAASSRIELLLIPAR